MVFPIYLRHLAGAVTGLTLGVLINGVILHQLFDWYNRINQPALNNQPITGAPLDLIWQNLYQALMSLAIMLTVLALWRYFRQHSLLLASPRFEGSALIGAGLFTIFDALIMHLLLNVHPLKPGVPLWDVGYLAYGILLVAIGITAQRLDSNPSEVSVTVEPMRL